MTHPAAGEGVRLSARRLRSRLAEASVSLRRPAWLRWPGPRADVADPSAAMFQRIRRSMTLLYASVLVVTLLLAGTVLYVAVEHRLMDPINSALDQSAQQTAYFWGSELAPVGQTPCTSGTGQRYSLFACYSSQGTLTGASQLAATLPLYTDPALARRALASPTGCAFDQVTLSQGAGDKPPGFGVVAREACVTRDVTSNAVVGVIQVGTPIEETVRALHQLLILLLIVGGFTALVAALGGFLLSARALVPARLAYTRQQRFIADVSHELRTPLTLLRADAETLLRGRARLAEDDAELLDDIVDETARLATMTSSLLTLARLDSANRLPERETIDLAEVAAQVSRRVEAYASGRQVTVRVEAEPGLLISGVRDLIDQAALILVDNAIKYNHPGGEVTLRAARHGEEVALTVRDTGVGVAPEHLAQLGERFFRPDKARARQNGQTGGAGLGLSIARSVAALHQGTLTFASAPDEGLTATLELPAARSRQPQPPAPDTPTPDDAPVRRGS